MVAGVSGLTSLLVGSALMALLALVGGLTLLLPRGWLQRLLLPLVALAAGSLLGGALFHMIPEGFSALPPRRAGGWVAAGFSVFLALEQLLQWHHSHRHGGRQRPSTQPLAALILLGDGLHNLTCGMGVASAYLMHPAAGVAAWLAAAAHEIPQELGDFGVLVQSGWSPRRALVWNTLSALTFPAGALLAWGLRDTTHLAPLVLFAAGNFLYVAASDLVPEIKTRLSLREALIGLGWFAAGLLVLALLATE
ncbi:MAG: ZIP family metal transporter [Synechococcaceae bacterium WBB_10_009]|nr:ZIP family metal transporter [Synechococcaceae bacterium WBB_10_009]